MKIIAYTVSNDPYKIIPANPKRSWMDSANAKNPYRCLPLSMANGFGWEILSPSKFIVEWNGGALPTDVRIIKVEGTQFPDPLFGEGTLAWHTGYLFKTDYPYGIYVTGAPNLPKHNIIPLTGIVETHWLPFTFTVNWKFTQPGSTQVEIGEPICQIFPIDMSTFDYTVPEIRSLEEDPQLSNDYWNWHLERSKFINDKSQQLIPGNSWQKSYFQGSYPPDNKRKCPFHMTDSGQLQSTHKTKAGVPEFKNYETVQFKTPQFYFDRLKQINDATNTTKQPTGEPSDE
jgi:hypothetical protein